MNHIFSRSRRPRRSPKPILGCACGGTTELAASQTPPYSWESPAPQIPPWGAAAPANLPRGMWGAAAPQPQSQRGASPQRRPPQGATYRRNHRAKLCPKLAVPPRWAYRKAKGATSRPRITNLEIPGNVLPSWRAVNRGSRGLVLWWFRVILGIDHSRGHSVFV